VVGHGVNRVRALAFNLNAEPYSKRLSMAFCLHSGHFATERLDRRCRDSRHADRMRPPSCGAQISIMGIARPLRPEFVESVRPSFASYPAISDATSRGCESIATWLAAISTTAAWRRLAMLRCRAGWMARSFVATR
jgi:hypothetical protein